MRAAECPICAANGKHSSSSFINTIATEGGGVINTWRCSRGHHWAIGPDRIAYATGVEERTDDEASVDG